jgi:hypothetical protein
MFENKELNGTKYSRIIASWMNAHSGQLKYLDEFRAWLRSLGATEEQMWEIYDMANDGKVELEINARVFHLNYKEENED